MLYTVYIIKEKPPVVPTPVVYYYSSNNYLKTLEAKGYEIKFDRDTLEYELNVNNDVKSLDITAIAEDSRSRVEITGNENFKTGNGTDFSSMFLHAVLPDNFKLPESFSTEKAVIISEMFCQCIFKSGFSLPPAFTIENAEKKDFIFTEAKGLGVITLTLRQIVKALHARYNSENQKNEDENSSYNGMELPSFAKKKK